MELLDEWLRPYTIPTDQDDVIVWRVRRNTIHAEPADEMEDAHSNVVGQQDPIRHAPQRYR